MSHAYGSRQVVESRRHSHPRGSAPSRNHARPIHCVRLIAFICSAHRSCESAMFNWKEAGESAIFSSFLSAPFAVKVDILGLPESAIQVILFWPKPLTRERLGTKHEANPEKKRTLTLAPAKDRSLQVHPCGPYQRRAHRYRDGCPAGGRQRQPVHGKALRAGSPAHFVQKPLWTETVTYGLKRRSRKQALRRLETPGCLPWVRHNSHMTAKK